MQYPVNLMNSSVSAKSAATSLRRNPALIAGYISALVLAVILLIANVVAGRPFEGACPLMDPPPFECDQGKRSSVQMMGMASAVVAAVAAAFPLVLPRIARRTVWILAACIVLFASISAIAAIVLATSKDF